MEENATKAQSLMQTYFLLNSLKSIKSILILFNWMFRQQILMDCAQSTFVHKIVMNLPSEVHCKKHMIAWIDLDQAPW